MGGIVVGGAVGGTKQNKEKQKYIIYGIVLASLYYLFEVTSIKRVDVVKGSGYRTNHDWKYEKFLKDNMTNQR